MSSTLAMTFTFDPAVSYGGTASIPPVTSTKTFGGNSEVVRFLTAYQGFLNQPSTASASTIIGAWWNSTTNDIVLNVGSTAPSITLT